MGIATSHSPGQDSQEGRRGRYAPIAASDTLLEIDFWTWLLPNRLLVYFDSLYTSWPLLGTWSSKLRFVESVVFAAIVLMCIFISAIPAMSGEEI